MSEVQPAWIMTKASEELAEHYRRQEATTYPVTLTHKEYCAIIAAAAILHDITLGVRYTHKPQLKRIQENEVDVLFALERRAAKNAMPPDKVEPM